MDEMKKFKIGDVTYRVDPLDPMSAIPFGLRVAKVAGPAFAGAASAGGTDEEKGAAVVAGLSSLDPEQLDSLMKAALKRTYTPDNECLENLASFNAWFRKHPGHLFEAGLKAVWELAKDFLPESLTSNPTVSGFLKPATSGGGSKSPRSGSTPS